MSHNYPDDLPVDVTDSRSPSHEEPTYTCIMCLASNEYADMATIENCKKCIVIQDEIYDQ